MVGTADSALEPKLPSDFAAANMTSRCGSLRVSINRGTVVFANAGKPASA